MTLESLRIVLDAVIAILFAGGVWFIKQTLNHLKENIDTKVGALSDRIVGTEAKVSEIEKEVRGMPDSFVPRNELQSQLGRLSDAIGVVKDGQEAILDMLNGMREER